MNLEGQVQPTKEEKLEIEKELFKNSHAVRVGQSMADYKAEMDALWNKMHPEKKETLETETEHTEPVQNNKEDDEQWKRKVEASEGKRQEDLKRVRKELGLDTLSTERFTGSLGKIQEYDERIRAVRAGKPIKNGDTEDVLLEDFRSFVKQDWSEDFDINKFQKERETSKAFSASKANESTGSSSNTERKGEKEEVLVSTEEREKLTGWSASYELAKIAKKEGLDLAGLSREEYAEYAIKNLLAIDDDQLRMAPWQRNGTSVEELLEGRKKARAEVRKETEEVFDRFFLEMKTKAAQQEQDRYLSEKIRVRSGTKDSDSWLFFGINDSLDGNRPETYKSYISVKDLNTLTPERFVSFLKALKDSDYHGDVKIFQDIIQQGTGLNDQIVMHGRSEKDSKLALEIAEKFFAGDLNKKGIGKDEIIDGKEYSYSQILARKIKAEIEAKRAS